LCLSATSDDHDSSFDHILGSNLNENTTNSLKRLSLSCLIRVAVFFRLVVATSDNSSLLLHLCLGGTTSIFFREPYISPSASVIYGSTPKERRRTWTFPVQDVIWLWIRAWWIYSCWSQFQSKIEIQKMPTSYIIRMLERLSAFPLSEFILDHSR